MELRQLRYFVALAEEMHYGNAADRLRISRPTLSQQIGVLERRLDAQLLQRDSRNLALTRAGTVLLEHAREVLAMADRLEAAVAAARHGERVLDVRVANGVDVVVAPALKAIETSLVAHVHFTVTDSMDAEDAVLTGRADAAVVWTTSAVHTTLHTEDIGDVEICLAVPDGHRLAERTCVPTSELAEETIALFPRRLAPGVWDAFANHLLPGRRLPGQILEEIAPFTPMLGMLRAAQEGRAIAPFVHIIAQTLALPGITLLPTDPPLHLQTRLVYRDAQRAELRDLADTLREASRGSDSAHDGE